MGTRKELNEIYNKYYQKDFPSATLSRWVKDGRIKATKNGRFYDYDLKQFEQLILNDEYKKKIKASKMNPKDFIGKKSGYLLIKGIVPKEEYKENYKGTLMYCDCLKCNKSKNIQVRFSYLSGQGNYQQLTCGCKRKEMAFLSTCRDGVTEEFLDQFSKDFEKFLFIHKALVKSTTDSYYSRCDIDEYKEAIEYFYYDKQFNSVYNFWLKADREKTFYDLTKPSIDHIIPKSKGGTNKRENLHFITLYENLAKRDMTWKEWINFKEKTHSKCDYFIESILGGDEE